MRVEPARAQREERAAPPRREERAAPPRRTQPHRSAQSRVGRARTPQPPLPSVVIERASALPQAAGGNLIEPAVGEMPELNEEALPLPKPEEVAWPEEWREQLRRATEEEDAAYEEEGYTREEFYEEDSDDEAAADDASYEDDRRYYRRRWRRW